MLTNRHIRKDQIEEEDLMRPLVFSNVFHFISKSFKSSALSLTTVFNKKNQNVYLHIIFDGNQFKHAEQVFIENISKKKQPEIQKSGKRVVKTKMCS